MNRSRLDAMSKLSGALLLAMLAAGCVTSRPYADLSHRELRQQFAETVLELAYWEGRAAGISQTCPQFEPETEAKKEALLAQYEESYADARAEGADAKARAVGLAGAHVVIEKMEAGHGAGLAEGCTLDGLFVLADEKKALNETIEALFAELERRAGKRSS